MLVVTGARVRRHRSDRDERQIIRADCVGHGCAALLCMDRAHPTTVGRFEEIRVGDLRAEHKRHALRMEPRLHRPDHGIVLIERGVPDTAQCANARELLQKSQHVALQLNGAVPRLKCECGPPHRPEIRREEVRRKRILDPLCAKDALRRCQQSHQFQTIVDAEPEVGRIEDRAAFADQPRLRIRAPDGVERPRLALHRLCGIGQRRHAVEHVPQAGDATSVNLRPQRVTQPFTGASQPSSAPPGTSSHGRIPL